MPRIRARRFRPLNISRCNRRSCQSLSAGLPKSAAHALFIPSVHPCHSKAIFRPSSLIPSQHPARSGVRLFCLLKPRASGNREALCKAPIHVLSFSSCFQYRYRNRHTPEYRYPISFPKISMDKQECQEFRWKAYPQLCPLRVITQNKKFTLIWYQSRDTSSPHSDRIKLLHYPIDKKKRVYYIIDIAPIGEKYNN